MMSQGSSRGYRFSLRRLFSLLAFLSTLLVLFVPQVFAQEADADPKTRSTEITALVRAKDPPPPPGLITPKDSAILTSGVVTFQWTQVTHINAIQRYELYLNGELKFGSIHNSNQNTDDYVLKIENGIYTLTLKNDKWLPDGQYTWKVRVIDSQNLGTDSTTWRFTVDSTPPNILITSVDGKPTAISALDPSTIPTEPIEVKRPNPEIVGHTEASSQVELLVTFEDGSIQRFKTQAHLDGTFRFRLERLPVGKKVVLTFTAIDLAQLTQVLDGLSLIYKPRVIRIPVPPIFPGQPTEITIYVRIPALPTLPPLTAKNFPPPFGPLVVAETPTPVPTETKLIEVPVFDATPWVWGWWIVLAGYIVSVFLLTRNSFSVFSAYLWALLRFWILGAEKKGLSWKNSQGKPLPFYGFTLTWLDAQHEYHERTGMTNPSGFWKLPQQLGNLYSVKNRHMGLPYPSTQAAKSSESVVIINGQSWTYSSNQSMQQKEDVWLLPFGQTEMIVEPSVQPLKNSVTGWSTLVWIPRCILVIELLLSLYLLWYVKTWLTILFLLVVLLIAARDLHVNLKEKLRVYGES